ncbi:MAG: hypothetical protein MR867_01660 [Eubacterium sp.]|nr:hypothetical protein [Eubacterium sp.]MDD7209985.1 hypothetical protein [Lachnospiraceae bacterium]MDY5496533.1 hypothetical protein [Anaerobutyricum sp.]
MRESLICIGKTTKNGYCFEDTGIRVFSYEELCFYLSQHMICYLSTLPGEDLLIFLREELGLSKLSRQLYKLLDPEKDQMKYFAALFREGNYFTEEEIRDILDHYRELKNEPVFRQEKKKGDLYVKCGRAQKALGCYRKALKQPKLPEEEKGALYHNQGIAWMKLFRFTDARLSFLKAYRYTGDEKSLFYYYCVIAFSEGQECAGKELAALDASDILLEAFEDRLEEMKEEFLTSAAGVCYRKILYMKENGRAQEAAERKAEMVQSLRHDFRKEIDT